MLDDVFGIIQNDLDRVDGILRDFYRHAGAAPDQLTRMVAFHFGASGKHLRPGLLVLAARCCAGNIPVDGEALARRGAAIELTHNASLVHDDIIDGSAFRRDQAALHHKFGTQQAVLAGDIMYTWALELLLQSSGPEGLGAVLACIEKMCRGEINRADRALTTPEEYYRLIEDKTASLMEMSCRLGAMQTCPDDARIGTLAAFGYHFGMAYQIMDDARDDEQPVELGIDFHRLMEGHIRQAKEALLPVPVSEYRQALDDLADFLMDTYRNHYARSDVPDET